ncbi:hypothetical protein [Pseudomonas kuykendallii]|uniref:hypothetical protein n=1 Tax=Pseudomonas kuykendallii TaxID=1007099 RepID=UPI0028D0C3E1|nr:hypothetical protein [Pseudomonas kuykendallii]
MTEQANRIDWLERQLAQVRDFVARDKARAEQEPNRPSIQLSLRSWQSHEAELRQELRHAKSALQHEVLELRLIGRRMDGSIPLRLLTKLADKLNVVLAHAAYHLRHGKGPNRKGLEPLLDEMDMRLSGLAFGSTRLVFAGNIEPDLTGDSAMGGALEKIFGVLESQDPERIRELVTVIGVPATKALSEMLGALDRQDIGAELTWPAPNAKIYKWGGSLAAVRQAHERLSPLERIKPEEITLSGRIAQLKDNGAFYIRDLDGHQIKISYNTQQYQHVQQYTLGMDVDVSVMRYVDRDPLTEHERATYKLVTPQS